MNRRDALQLLMGLPAVQSIAIADIQTTDVIVVECDQPMSMDEKARIGAQLATIWPGRKIVVFDQGMRMRIARNTVTA